MPHHFATLNYLIFFNYHVHFCELPMKTDPSSTLMTNRRYFWLFFGHFWPLLETSHFSFDTCYEIRYTLMQSSFYILHRIGSFSLKLLDQESKSCFDWLKGQGNLILGWSLMHFYMDIGRYIFQLSFHSQLDCLPLKTKSMLRIYFFQNCKGYPVRLFRTIEIREYKTWLNEKLAFRKFDEII